MKVARHEKMKELIQQYDIDTQEELAARLKEAGFQVTQATVSRDIRALKMTKVTGTDGKSRYAILEFPGTVVADQYTRMLSDALVSVARGMNIVVLHTLPGMAMGVGAALDAMKWEEVLGSIAGDDTVMCISANEENAEFVAKKLEKYIRTGERT